MVPNLWGQAPPKGHRMNLTGHEIINEGWREEEEEEKNNVEFDLVMKCLYI